MDNCFRKSGGSLALLAHMWEVAFFQTDEFIIYSVLLKYHAVDYFLGGIIFPFFNRKYAFKY